MRELPLELQHREGVAADLLRGTGCDDPPVDAFELADLCDFDVQSAESRLPALDVARRIIRVDLGQDEQRLHMDVAHELFHWAQTEAKLENTEDGARFGAGCLMVPRWSLETGLRPDWSLARLGRIHVNASAEAIATRITQVRDAVVALVDPRGRKTAFRRKSPWLTDSRLDKITRWERDLAARAWRAGEEVRGDDAGLCYAIPVIKGDYQRVVVVCELEQLSLRLNA